MLERITLRLHSQEIEALQNLAIAEYRDFRSQAAFIIRKELERRGLIGHIDNENCSMLFCKAANEEKEKV